MIESTGTEFGTLYDYQQPQCGCDFGSKKSKVKVAWPESGWST